MGKKLYWDDVNGKVTDDDKWAEIYTCDGCDIYVETYEVKDYKKHGGTLIDFAYSKGQKRMGTYFLLKAHLEHNGLQMSDLGNLVRLCVPEDVYRSAVEEYSYLLKDDDGKEKEGE